MKKSVSVNSETQRFIASLNNALESDFSGSGLEIMLADGKPNGLLFKSQIEDIFIARFHANTDYETYKVSGLIGSDSGIRLQKAIEKYINENPRVRLALSSKIYFLTKHKHESFLPTLLKRAINLNFGIRRFRHSKPLEYISANVGLSCCFENSNIVLYTSDEEINYELTIQVLGNEVSAKPSRLFSAGQYLKNELLSNDIMKIEKQKQNELIEQLIIASCASHLYKFNTDLEANYNSEFFECVRENIPAFSAYIIQLYTLFNKDGDREINRKVIELDKEEQDLLLLTHDIQYPAALNEYLNRAQ